MATIAFFGSSFSSFAVIKSYSGDFCYSNNLFSFLTSLGLNCFMGKLNCNRVSDLSTLK